VDTHTVDQYDAFGEYDDFSNIYFNQSFYIYKNYHHEKFALVLLLATAFISVHAQDDP
jgi:hypothetical protein